jgi:hypothetical protein
MEEWSTIFNYSGFGFSGSGEPARGGRIVTGRRLGPAPSRLIAAAEIHWSGPRKVAFKYG